MFHGQNRNNVFFIKNKIIIGKKKITMIKILRKYLQELGFTKEQYTVIMKQKYIELHLQNTKAVEYILSDNNEHELKFIQYIEKPILIITWKNE